MYRTKDQFTVNFRMSNYLHSGISVIAARMKASKSEVLRIAVLDLIRQNFDKGEQKILSDRPDLCDEWINFYESSTQPIPYGSDDPKFLEKMVLDGEIEEIDEDQFDDVFLSKLKQIKKRHILNQSEQFLHDNMMTANDARKLFDNYEKKLEEQAEKKLKQLIDDNKKLLGETGEKVKE